MFERITQTCWKCCCLNIRVLSIWGVMVQVCSSCLDAPSTWCLTPQIAKHLIFNRQFFFVLSFYKRLLALPIHQWLDHFQSLLISLSTIVVASTFVLWLLYLCCGFYLRVVASTFILWLLHLWLLHLCCGFYIHIVASTFVLWLLNSCCGFSIRVVAYLVFAIKFCLKNT